MLLPCASRAHEWGDGGWAVTPPGHWQGPSRVPHTCCNAGTWNGLRTPLSSQTPGAEVLLKDRKMRSVLSEGIRPL